MGEGEYLSAEISPCAGTLLAPCSTFSLAFSWVPPELLAQPRVGRITALTSDVGLQAERRRRRNWGRRGARTSSPSGQHHLLLNYEDSRASGPRGFLCVKGHIMYDRNRFLERYANFNVPWGPIGERSTTAVAERP